MALSANFKKEYYLLLRRCCYLVERSQRYEAICRERVELKSKIDGYLEQRHSFCTDCERLIDMDSGKLRPGAEAVVGNDPQITDNLIRLAELLVELRGFDEEFGWNDDFLNHAMVVIAISNYEEMEKSLIAELGRDAAQRIIYEIKKKVLEFENELGITFFKGAVEQLEDLFRIKILYSPDSILLTGKDNVSEQNLTLINNNGEYFPCQKTGEIHYNNTVYVEIIFSEKMAVKKLNYYSVVQAKDGQRLTLEEDEQICDTLFDILEKMIK